MMMALLRDVYDVVRINYIFNRQWKPGFTHPNGVDQVSFRRRFTASSHAARGLRPYPPSFFYIGLRQYVTIAGFRSLTEF